MAVTCRASFEHPERISINFNSEVDEIIFTVSNVFSLLKAYWCGPFYVTVVMFEPDIGCC